MIKIKGRLITTHLMRNGNKFTKEALEDSVKQINEGSKIIPFNINHDSNRQIGFTLPDTAKLVKLDDGEYAIEAEINVFENEEERAKYKIETDRDEEIFLEKLNTKAIKRNDTNCPTYWIDNNIFSILKIKPSLNKNNLLIVSNSKDILQKGISINRDFIVLFNPFLRRSLSIPNAYNKPLIDELKKIKSHNPSIELSFSVIPQAFSLKSEFREVIELDYSWGPKIPKDLSMLQKGVTQHIASDEDRIYENFILTDFWWYENDDGIMTLEIEELCDESRFLIRNQSRHFPMRYSHLQYDKKFGKIVHLDCAVRIYSENEYKERVGQNDISRAGKKSQREKLFRLDGEVESKDAFDVVSLFFRGNSDVRQYLDLE